MAPFSVALVVSFISLIPRLSNHSDSVARLSVCRLHFPDNVLSHWSLMSQPVTGYSINKEKGPLDHGRDLFGSRESAIFTRDLARRSDSVINCGHGLPDAAW